MEIATGQRKYLDETEIGHAALAGAVSTAGDKAVVNAAKSLRKKKVELYETFGKIFIQTGDQVGTDVIHRNIDKDKK